MTPVGTTNSPNVLETVNNSERQRVLDAARQFEAIFVRKMLSSLEKTQSIGGSERGDTGSSIYGSMMVGALSGVVTQGDGIGLSELVLRALSHPGEGKET